MAPIRITDELERVAQSYALDGNAPYTVDLLMRARAAILQVRRTRREEKLARTAKRVPAEAANPAACLERRPSRIADDGERAEQKQNQNERAERD